MRAAKKRVGEGDTVIEDIALGSPPKGVVTVKNSDLHALANYAARMRRVVNGGGMRLNTRVGILRELRQIETVLVGYLQPRLPGTDDDVSKPRVGGAE